MLSGETARRHDALVSATAQPQIWSNQTPLTPRSIWETTDVIACHDGADHRNTINLQNTRCSQLYHHLSLPTSLYSLSCLLDTPLRLPTMSTERNPAAGSPNTNPNSTQRQSTQPAPPSRCVHVVAVRASYAHTLLDRPQSSCRSTMNFQILTTAMMNSRHLHTQNFQAKSMMRAMIWAQMLSCRMMGVSIFESLKRRGD